MTELDRRGILALGVGVLGVACTKAKDAHDEHEEEEVTPAEDLMREHGLLERILVVYEEAARVLDTRADAQAQAAIARSADIVRTFVEDYHEQLEEQQLFPRFEKKKKLVELVGVLRAQHALGRKLTEAIRADAKNESEDARRRVTAAIRAFATMYRPHAAREDTVLFAALPQVVSASELHEMGEAFEDVEHQKFGKAGFEGMVSEVAAIEKTLGIDDLAHFSPKLS